MLDHVQISRGENNENNDSYVQSEFEEIVAEIDPIYDQNFPSLTKRTKDHRQSQVIGDAFSVVLTRTQHFLFFKK